jgi:type 1 glutamine amidotransferase
MTPGLEDYNDESGSAKNIEVLSYGLDPKYKELWPLEWTVTYGKGRIYSSTFGHVWADDKQPESMRCADEQTLILRVIQWLAQRPVTVPVPKDFPTAEHVSIRPEIPLPQP